MIFHCVPKCISFCLSIHLVICALCFNPLVIVTNAAFNIGVFVQFPIFSSFECTPVNGMFSRAKHFLLLLCFLKLSKIS